MEQLVKPLNYKGNIVIMEGDMGQAAQIKRSKGTMNVVAKYSILKIIT